MTEVFFSIVIPTMDRHETLPDTIRTCLAQNYGNYEIVVSDNFSGPETRAAVESFCSDRIRYFRTEARLAMRDSFEFAVSCARGEFVIVLGDDDAVLSHALHELNKIISLHHPLAVRWDRVYYNWPSIVPTVAAGWLQIPVNGDDRVTRVKGSAVIPLVANGELDYQMLPMLYNSAVSSRLIADLKEKTGRVFQSRSPDVYSGFALAFLAGEYLSLSLPMTINAGSAKSNGASGMHETGTNPVTISFLDLNAKSGIHIHRCIPDVLVMPVGIADSFLHAKDALFPAEPKLSLDVKKLIRNSLAAARPNGAIFTKNAVASFRAHVAHDPALSKWLEKVAQHLPPCESEGPVPLPPFVRGVTDGWLRVIASDFGVVDVHGAAQLCDRLMGYCRKDLQWTRQQKLVTGTDLKSRVILSIKKVLTALGCNFGDKSSGGVADAA